MAVPVTDTAALRRARAAVAACFFLNAVFYAGLVPRLPEVKAQLGLSSTALGTALAALPLGALLAGLSSAALIRRFGSGRVASYGLVLLGVVVWTVSVAPNWLGLAAALLVLGALDAVVDVAQNAHGLRVQRHYGRSIINAFHGVWSVGAVTGGLLGSAAAGLGVPLGAHLAASAVLFGAVAVVGSRALLPGRDEPDPVPGEHPRVRPRRRTAVPALAVLGVLAACGAFVEDAGASWSALYLRTELAAGAATAGLGVATLIPAVYQAADELPGLPHGVGLAVINWLLRIGFLVSPPLIGALADLLSLRVALLAVVLAGLGALVLGRALPGRSAAARTGG